MQRHELLRTTDQHEQTRGDRLVLRLGFDAWQEITDDEERLCIKIPRWFPKFMATPFLNFWKRVLTELTAEEQHG